GGKVFINEVLANEAGSDTAGELVELVNSGGTSVDLSGWTISDATAVRHVFAAGTTLGAGRAIVVFAGASAIPGGLTNAIASSTGSFVFGNSGDTVKLGNPAGLVDSVTYTSTLSGTDGVSMNRSPDGSATGTFVLHTTLATAPRSAGTRVTGAAF
ncbi:MAG: lamin tail domain-containing protein, partial [Myxococcales bacterium]|nr:lamin tail domain-containing protein [Myxococcales bacterium]